MSGFARISKFFVFVLIKDMLNIKTETFLSHSHCYKKQTHAQEDLSMKVVRRLNEADFENRDFQI